MTKNEKWLSSLKTITDIKVLVKALGLTPQSEISFWRDLLALLRSEKAPIKFSAGEEPVESLMGFITTYADLADEEGEPIISSLYNELKVVYFCRYGEAKEYHQYHRDQQYNHHRSSISQDVQ